MLAAALAAIWLIDRRVRRSVQRHVAPGTVAAPAAATAQVQAAGESVE